MPAPNQDCLVADERVLLGLGSNIGDRQATIRAAIDALAATPGVTIRAISRLRETRPVGNIEQPHFLNAAVCLVTGLEPRCLLDVCLQIELRHGRARRERWGPRTLDIDVLLYGDRLIDEPGLHVPHPRMHERLFALVPAAEIAGDMKHPAYGISLDALLQRYSANSGERRQD